MSDEEVVDENEDIPLNNLNGAISRMDVYTEKKDCPKCGGESQCVYDPYDDSFFVRCNKCNIESEHCRTMQDAVEKWNECDKE